MKYILICSAAMILCFAAGYLIVRLFLKGCKGKVKRTVFTALTGILLMILLTLAYMGIYSHAGSDAEAALKGNETVTVSSVDGGWFFDGPSEDKAIIFYQGAKVECTSYAPLMIKLAEEGFDCFLADMPFNFAIFGGDYADKFIEKYSYDTWIMAGHSMGGIMAASYADEHSNKISGLLLLASYTSIDIDDNIKLCSIYGSEDGCLDMEEYEAGKENWPVNSEEKILQGGNHSQYGDYGEQKGDGEALIDAEVQQNMTAQAVSSFFKKQQGN